MLAEHANDNPTPLLVIIKKIGNGTNQTKQQQQHYPKASVEGAKQNWGCGGEWKLVSLFLFLFFFFFPSHIAMSRG